ncbi:hypothetical protein PR048_017962 [Dryococelus australis]|uniref:Uncharacterized protein n=1 Tax=Dryococelus australis TaxID=614101 RepID=A0ABQ9HBB2_9NEOP|nr:hypothetical protein PR048_017962 [Dryococelus australis]
MLDSATMTDVTNEDETAVEDELPEPDGWNQLTYNITVDCQLQDFVAVDENVEVYGQMTDAELIELATKQEENSSSWYEQKETPQAALEALDVLNNFYRASNTSVTELQHVEALVVQNVTNKKKQMTIDSFFQKYSYKFFFLCNTVQ